MPQRSKGRSNGEGTIYEYPKESGIWFAEISLPDGRRRKRQAKTQRDARELLKQLQSAVAQGLDLTAHQPTVTEWCRTWLAHFAPNLKPNICDDYHGIIQRYIATAPLGQRRLDKLTPADVQAWVNDLAARVQPKTVRNAYGRLHKALEVAVRNQYVARNVAKHVELPAVPTPHIQPLTVSQVMALLRVVQSHRWYAMYRLAVNLGMREGELFGLTWPAIDFAAGTIRIHQQLRRARIGGKADAPREFLLQPTKTKAGERTLKLDADLLAVLQAHKANYDEERALLGVRWRDPFGNLVFTTDTGAPIHMSILRRHFVQVCKAAKLPPIRFHDLRHTAATLMLDNSVPLVTVSKILGHSSPAITATIYAHALDESKAGAIAALSQQLRPPLPDTVAAIPAVLPDA
jgi:integrase